MSTDNSADTTPDLSSNSKTAKQSRIISKVLSPAVRLWLRSQVQQVSHLEVKISGSDRQILTGNIPRVLLLASNAVYQGLHLSQIHLVGEGIRTNFGQVLRGQPLKLLEPVPVFGELLLQESDLNASLQAPLLADALTELLQILFTSDYLVEDQQLLWQKINIEPEQVTISGTLAVNTSHPTPIVIRCGFQLASSHELQLIQPQIQTQADKPGVTVDNLKLDLGTDVALEELTLSSGQLVCRGRINVIP